MTAKKKNPLAEFNLNSILVLVATAVVGWITTNGLSSIKATRDTALETKTAVGKIETAIPYINQNVNSLQQDLNTKHADLRQQIVDLKDGQKQAWGAIKDVREEQEKVKERLLNPSKP